jgi:hypothetical protein
MSKRPDLDAIEARLNAIFHGGRHYDIFIDHAREDVSELIAYIRKLEAAVAESAETERAKVVSYLRAHKRFAIVGHQATYFGADEIIGEIERNEHGGAVTEKR